MTAIRTAAALALAVLGFARPAAADVIISNLPGNNGGGSFINAPLGGSFAGTVQNSKAAGFTMPAGTPYSLTTVQLRLSMFFAASVPVVALYDNNALNNPGSQLLTLTNPAFLINSTPTTYDFTPPTPFALQPSTTYWIVLSNAATVADSYFWSANNPNITPTGLAVSAGYRFNDGPPPPFTASSSFNSYAVVAAVPEPTTLATTGLVAALFGWAASRRGRAVPS